jgi:hypothetical protein
MKYAITYTAFAIGLVFFLLIESCSQIVKCEQAGGTAVQGTINYVCISNSNILNIK